MKATLTKHTSTLGHIDYRTGKTFALYAVSVDGVVVGYVGQFPTHGHHSGIRPNSSTGTVKRWGFRLGNNNPESVRIPTLQWGCKTRDEALEALLRAAGKEE